MKQTCANCEYLNKDKKMTYGKAYLYGCGLRPDGYVSTWINTDKFLSSISCSTPKGDDEEEEVEQEIEVRQMTIDEWLGGI